MPNRSTIHTLRVHIEAMTGLYNNPKLDNIGESLIGIAAEDAIMQTIAVMLAHHTPDIDPFCDASIAALQSFMQCDKEKAIDKLVRFFRVTARDASIFPHVRKCYTKSICEFKPHLCQMLNCEVSEIEACVWLVKFRLWVHE